MTTISGNYFAHKSLIRQKIGTPVAICQENPEFICLCEDENSQECIGTLHSLVLGVDDFGNIIAKPWDFITTEGYTSVNRPVNIRLQNR